MYVILIFFFSSRRRHTRFDCDWSSDVCSSDLNPGLTALLNTLFHAHIGDGYCGMRGFTRSLYDRLDLRSSGMEFALEMVIKSAQIGARIAEIPITLWPDKRGRAPHLRSFRDGWGRVRFL